MEKKKQVVFWKKNLQLSNALEVSNCKGCITVHVAKNYVNIDPPPYQKPDQMVASCIFIRSHNEN